MAVSWPGMACLTVSLCGGAAVMTDIGPALSSMTVRQPEPPAAAAPPAPAVVASADLHMISIAPPAGPMPATARPTPVEPTDNGTAAAAQPGVPATQAPLPVVNTVVLRPLVGGHHPPHPVPNGVSGHAPAPSGGFNGFRGAAPTAVASAAPVHAGGAAAGHHH